MSEVKEVTVTVSNPSECPGDTGRVTSGFYVLDENRRLTMTNEHGVPVRRRNGEPWTCLLKPEDNPRAIASILTKQIRMSIRGDDLGGFNRPLDFEFEGWR